MRKFVLSFVAVLTAVVMRAGADPAFDSFKQICVDAHANADKALATADQLGWMPIPKMMLDQFPKGEFNDPRGRLRSTDDEFILVVLAHGAPLFSPDVEVQICAVAVMPGRPQGFDKLAAELAGVEKETISDKPAYIWREENGKHIKVERNAPDLKKYVANGNLNFLVALGRPKLSMVMLAVPGAASAKP